MLGPLLEFIEIPSGKQIASISAIRTPRPGEFFEHPAAPGGGGSATKGTGGPSLRSEQVTSRQASGTERGAANEMVAEATATGAAGPVWYEVQLVSHHTSAQRGPLTRVWVQRVGKLTPVLETVLTLSKSGRLR